MPASDVERTYLAAGRTMPFCKGCGHTHVLRRLDEALHRLELPPREVCLVTDIGCIGLADALFDSVHTVHTTHGRSTAFATGIQIADGVLGDRRLHTVVLIGDGGAMIGLQHIVGAALLNADLTLLVCNNFLFGMTGGQNSAFSPYGFVTPTTPRGNIVPPIDLCRIAQASGAGFVARSLATDRDLGALIAAAIAHPGLALVEIVELCTEHATARNDLKGGAVAEILAVEGQTLGVLAADGKRAEFAARYRERYPRPVAPPAPADDRIVASFPSSLHRPVGIWVAGSAGERVQSAAHRFCAAATRAGLWVTQKNDNPVTQGSGFSLAEVIVAPEEILYTGIDSPDAVIVVSRDGLAELAGRGAFAALRPDAILLIDSTLEVPPTPAAVHRAAFRERRGGSQAADAALAHYLEMARIFPPEASAAAGQ